MYTYPNNVTDQLCASKMYVERLNFFSDEDLVVDDERDANQRLRAFRAIKFGEQLLQ